MRLTDEMPSDGPYRPISDPRGAMRRRLTNRDRDLYVATLGVYQRESGLPRNTILTPVYAREIVDARNRRYTAFGITEQTRQQTWVNFLIADQSSFG